MFLDTVRILLMQSSFVHLHIHTEFSLVDGIVRIKPLMKEVAAQGMPAVALTDQSNMFAMVKFYKAAIAAGVKPIIGVDAKLVNPEDMDKPHRVVFLCMNNRGYHNLTKLVSMSYQQGQHRGIPMMQLDWLESLNEGLIVLLGQGSDLGQPLMGSNLDLAKERLHFWQNFFKGRLYFEISRAGRPDEESFLHSAVTLAGQTGIPVVASNDVHFLKADDFDAHEARVCINEGRVLDDPRRPKRFTNQQYLRSVDEMLELFSDIPEALENSIEIAKRCTIELTLGKNFLPNFPVPAGKTMEEYFGELSRAGLEERLVLLLDANADDYLDRRKVYDDRLQVELDVINNMGFPGYFLIVADFIKWAKDNDIPVGPGRGSGAGSLVAYALLITDLDPIEYELLFERFLNPERVSMPDFDIDFCMENRDRVIEYVSDHYGKEKVSQIITYGTMAAKAVVRDVGRVLGHAYGFTDRLAKMIPFEIGITLDKALEQEEALRDAYKDDEEVANLIDLARSLEGITRNAGKHAGGVVISPSALTDFSPLYCDETGGNLVTQFDKNDVEDVGLVKFDFLGLRTLTIIDWALKAINEQKREQGHELLDITRIPLDDNKTFDLLKACQTTAVFQLESRGMKDLIKRLQPDVFEDIIALVALFRPGPLQSGMVDDFINRKHGRAKVVYPHPDVGPTLKPTYGVILYQEQVMQIAQVLAGFSLGGADMLRRAMGKKKPEEMDKQRGLFVEGAKLKEIDVETSGGIFDLMEKFAGYGFNKSHSAAYALVSYQTAWLKAHYPTAFLAAVMSADMDNTEKVVILIEECEHMKLEVQAPNVNNSMHKFRAVDDVKIHYGLGAIKGVGESAIEIIVAERETNGKYKDLFDFCQRVDLKKVNRRVLETLARCGALDELGPNRASLMASLSTATRIAEQHTKNSAAGQNDMFGFASQQSDNDGKAQWTNVAEWDDKRRLQAEKETLGLYLTGHPIDFYRTELKRFVSTSIAKLQPMKRTKVFVAGLLISMRFMKTKKGDTMAIITLDDRTARIEIAVFSNVLEQYREILATDKIIIAAGEVSLDEYSGRLRMQVKELYDMDSAREHFAKRMVIRISPEAANNGFVQHLANTLTPYKEGGCPIFIRYATKQATAGLKLGEEWKIRPTDDLIEQLTQITGKQSIELEY